MRLIDADVLLEKVREIRKLALDRAVETPANMPFPIYQNPAYTRYSTQADEREKFKVMIEEAPSIQSERKTGHWVEIGDEPYDEWECDVCGFVIDGSGCIDPEEYRDVYRFCPNCGAKMKGERKE